MLYRRLGGSGLKISELALGSWLTYGNGVEDNTAEKIIDTAYESGINFFDSANVYAFGEAERVVGKALKKYRRDTYVISTKVFFPMSDGVNDRGLSRKHITEQVNQSLKRLNLDYIDILFCHRYDPQTPIEETLRTIDDFVRQGKILYVGVSMWTAEQIRNAVGVADKLLLDHIVVNQPSYNMLNRDIEAEIIPVCKTLGIGQVVYCPLAQGFLTGKYLGQKQIPKDSRAANDKMNGFISEYMNGPSLEKTEKIKEIADQLGIPMAQLALAWILREDNISSAIIGASKPSQIEMNVKASGYKIPDDILCELEKIL